MEGKIKNHVSRKLDRTFDYKQGSISTSTNELMSIIDYCAILKRDLHLVKEYYEADFNKKNTNTIDEYIDLFNCIYEKIFAMLFNDEIVKNFDSVKYQTYFGISRQFNAYTAEDTFRKNLISVDKQKDMAILNDNTYDKLNDYIKKVFMIEKFCEFTTLDFWKENTVTDIKNFDVNSKFNMFVKVITPFNWRCDEETAERIKYYNDRIATSTSMITNNKISFFSQFTCSPTIGLVLSAKKGYLAGNGYDAMLEEKINDNNPLESKTNYTNINRIGLINKNGTKHEVYGLATLIATPKGIERLTETYNEVILNKDEAKPIAVFYSTNSDYKYAQSLERKYKLPIVKLPEIIKDDIYTF